MTIAVVDYGMGNLRSVEKALKKVGHRAVVTGDAEVVAKAAGVVLPGVGAFGDCVENMALSGLDEAVVEAIDSGRPFLGICLGLQLLLVESEEDTGHKGLGVLKGVVRRLPSHRKIPHMGWNQVVQLKQAPLFKGIPDRSYFYFVHSYYVDAVDGESVVAQTDYGLKFTSGVWRDNLFAVQFHPEKSGISGLKLLDNFGRLCA